MIFNDERGEITFNGKNFLLPREDATVKSFSTTATVGSVFMRFGSNRFCCGNKKRKPAMLALAKRRVSSGAGRLMGRSVAIVTHVFCAAREGFVCL
ncbi:hypothetical protein CDAR_449861 [Caerostris darwini]|uniref:Uncharacterized protein n=1 Tax=Caerostris darwini TaxID=1538125 RepID=A0AAV4QVF3_9ARAC|nr:hypothetical protein CDAR_449861 [Caerostris darwini]